MGSETQSIKDDRIELAFQQNSMFILIISVIVIYNIIFIIFLIFVPKLFFYHKLYINYFFLKLIHLLIKLLNLVKSYLKET